MVHVIAVGEWASEDPRISWNGIFITFSSVTHGSVFSLKTSRILKSLRLYPTCKLMACYSLMVAGRRCKTPDSEMKKSLIQR